MSLLAPDMSGRPCAQCGKDPADGVAEINGLPLCHIEGQIDSCYMQEAWKELADVLRRSQP